MRLSAYIQRTRALGDATVEDHELDAIGEAIAEGADLPTVLKRRSAALTPRLLLGVWRAARRHARHEAFLQGVAARRREAGQSQIVWALLKSTVAEHEVGVLERAEELAPPGRGAEHRRRDAIKSGLALWHDCIGLLRREAGLSIDLATEDEALMAEFGDHVDTVTLEDTPSDVWLTIQRGVRLGALTLSFELPAEEMLALVHGRGAELSALAAGRNAEQLLQTLVMPDVEAWTLALKDEKSCLTLTRRAGSAYLELLCAPRPSCALVASVWVPRAGEPLSVAIVLRDGRLMHHGEVPITDDLVAGVEALIGSHPVEAIVLPTQADDAATLEALVEGFAGGNLEILRETPVALAEGLASFTEELPMAASAALLLGRRAVRPLKYWVQVPPMALGLVPPELVTDTEMLLTGLEEMRQLAQAGVKPSDLVKGGPGARGRAAVKALNPMLKSVDDLRPGMEVNGIVTNITQFGAFLNIGLGHEGLVHVSELADHFVNDPTEVVQVGQQVEARVLGVDRARRRISLSLRSEGAPRPPAAAGEGAEGDGAKRGGVRLDDIPGRGNNRRKSGFGGAGRRQPVTGASRAQALRDLESLFKK